ncbi:MFS transporter [Kineosporia succinea]|uniref:DHA1 family inner membrane transport protein n=1 Tax=Kineosporia succinea TaxID=84632 RepID=A0ABT9PDF3_9ACTN|nr:MFS transporter [Kineosporia succinea]MDP9830734.1 DHA1 family inner membrane transport protein [Kineosporia succinea]
MSPLRRNAALLALALGGFAIGLTEFAAMGLLPEVARDLLAPEYAQSAERAIGHAGWLISAYALGVVVGAPAVAALSARMPRKRLVLVLLGWFVLGTAASALAPTFELALVGRFLAGLPHGAYFGAAGLVASRLIGPNSHAKGFSLVIAGLTVANVVGVPAVTYLGQVSTWRIANLVVSAAFALTLIAVLALVPEVGRDEKASPAAELRALRSGQVWLVAFVASVGFAGFLAIYTYASPVTTVVAGLDASVVPWVLATAGIGMTVGNALGGFAADRHLKASLISGFAAVLAASALFWLIARTPSGLFVSIFVIGATSMFLSPALQARLIQVAPGAQLMGAAVSQSSMNIANSLGAWIGGVVIAQGLGYLSPAVVGVGLAAVGLVLTVVSFRERRSAAVAAAMVPAA